tara:strand:+ start:9266 stop:9904 length:639 start_codon:yes stop_codon:yes gene_type:complete
MQPEIKKVLSRSVCTGWDRGFLESILSQLDNGRELSRKQKDMASKVLARNGEEAQKLHEEWDVVYKEDHQQDGLLLAHYYKNTGYFRELTADILAGKTPDMRAYVKMSGNKYAEKVLEQARAEPKYAVGDYILRRSSFDAYKHAKFDNDMTWAQQNSVVTSFAKKGGFIVAVEKEIYSAANGAKRYKVLPVGEAIMFTVEERFIKIAKKRKS